MQLEHSFTVPVPPADAWKVLLDIERVAPCMPGATLDSVDGDGFTGKVKVKLGAIALTYGGKARFVETDEAARRVVIDGSGRETRGSGTAKATIVATMQPGEANSTQVTVSTDLAITGKPAQFGRGVMTDVGNKLIGQFADCLAGELAGGGVGTEGSAAAAPAVDGAPGATGVAGTAATTGDGPLLATGPAGPVAKPRQPTTSSPPAQQRTAEEIDLLQVAGGAVAKRVAYVAVPVLAVALLVAVALRRRR